MINSFSQYLIEEQKTVYFTFGRLNPPTMGHEMLLNKLAKAAGKNPYKIYLSKSNDPKKNPLSYNDKIKFARKMFPKHARQIIKNNKINTIMDIASALFSEGYINVVMAVDGPRSREFDILLNKYNGVKGRHGFYNFKSIKFVNVGERNDSSEGIDGVSATKQRNAAKDNDFVAFTQGLPKSMSNKDAKQLFNAVRKGMGLKEAKEFKRHIQLEPVSELREAYIRDNIFEEGERVVMTKKGIVGNIKYLGTNYLIIESKGETWRCWLDEVSKVDPNARPPHVEADYGATIDAGPYKLSESVDWVCGKCNCEPCRCSEINEAQKWKKGGPDGEIHTQHKGTTWRVRKDYNHNDRHVGEYRIEYKKKNPYGAHDWEWHDTVQGKEHAKSRLPEANQPEWGTPESTKKAKGITPGEKNEGLWDNIRARRAAGKPKLKPGDKNYPKTLKIETQQDPDIKDRPGSQPAGYHKGLSRAQKIARDRQFKRQTKMSDNDPKAYKPAPGDKTSKTRLSKHTLKYRKMYGED